MESLPILDRLILKASDESSFQVSRESQEWAETCLKSSTKFSLGDKANVDSLFFRVVDCFPFASGRIGPQTAIVVLPPDLESLPSPQVTLHLTEGDESEDTPSLPAAPSPPEFVPDQISEATPPQKQHEPQPKVIEDILNHLSAPPTVAATEIAPPVAAGSSLEHPQQQQQQTATAAAAAAQRGFGRWATYLSKLHFLLPRKARGGATGEATLDSLLFPDQSKSDPRSPWYSLPSHITKELDLPPEDTSEILAEIPAVNALSMGLRLLAGAVRKAVGVSVDPCTLAVASPEALVDLGIEDGSWVIVSNTATDAHRLCFLLSSKSLSTTAPTPAQSAVCLSPVLYHSLFGHAPSMGTTPVFPILPPQPQPRGARATTNPPPICKLISTRLTHHMNTAMRAQMAAFQGTTPIQPIASLKSSHVELCEIEGAHLGALPAATVAKRALLCYFFGASRALSTGDVFAVPIDESYMESVFMSSHAHPRHAEFAKMYAETLESEKEEKQRAVQNMLTQQEQDQGDPTAMHSAFGAKGGGKSDQHHEHAKSDPSHLDNANAVLYYRVVSIKAEGSSDEATGTTRARPGLFVDFADTKITERGKAAAGRVPPHAKAVAYGNQRMDSHATMLDALECLPTYHALLSYCSPLFARNPTSTLTSSRGTSSSTMFVPSLPLLIYGQRGSGKKALVHTMCSALGIHLIEINAFELVATSELETVAHLKEVFQLAASAEPCCVHLRNVHAIGGNESVANPGQTAQQGRGAKVRLLNTLKALLTTGRRQGYPSLLVASTEDLDKLCPPFRGFFLHKIHTQPPDVYQRRTIIDSMLGDAWHVSPDLDIDYVARQTAGANLSAIRGVVSDACNAAVHRLRHRGGAGPQYVLRESTAAQAGPVLCSSDFETALKTFRGAIADDIGAPKVPNVKWEDIGGLAHAKTELLDTIQLPLHHPDLFASGLKQRSGVLLYGPPGTGKTLLAKAVATECALSFLAVKGPELINMYVGESERNIRDIFNKARDASPCVIFFDELDALAPNRGVNGDSGGVMDRIVSQLLAELDGLQQSKDLFVVGATNRPDLVDPALLRPGRFDRLVYLGVSSTKADQEKIVTALTRKFQLSDDVDVKSLIAPLPLTLTGADMYALCSDALTNAMMRRAGEMEAKLEEHHEAQGSRGMGMAAFLETLPEHELQVEVRMEDFVKARQGVRPSVAMEDLLRYESLQENFAP